jgi:site-specific DNA-methyltransferase (adenine-specific)
MNNIKLYHGNNISILEKLLDADTVCSAIYADCIYESLDFSWTELCYNLLERNGVFFVQTDQHSVYEMKLYLDTIFGKENFINHLIYIQEWGGTSKRFFPKKHDDILFYAKGKDYKFYPDRILIPKKTAGTAFDKKGTGTKIPCDVFYDLGNFSTISREREKTNDGKNVQWQKPLKLIERLLLPTTDESDLILDLFMGSGTTGVFAVKNNRDFIGIEQDKNIFAIAKKRIDKAMLEIKEGK